MSSVAAIHVAKGQEIDQLLIDVADKSSSLGLRLGGLVQVATGGDDTHRSTAVNVIDLRTGERQDIWEPRGRFARSCRLNESGLAVAEAAVLQSINEGIDLLFLNRFGRAESKGRGLTECFAAALSTGIPILTVVRQPFDDAWASFHGGLADTDFGTNREGCRINVHLYQLLRDGVVKKPQITMQQMIDKCVVIMAQENIMPADQARTLLRCAADVGEVAWVVGGTVRRTSLKRIRRSRKTGLGARQDQRLGESALSKAAASSVSL